MHTIRNVQMHGRSAGHRLALLLLSLIAVVGAACGAEAAEQPSATTTPVTTALGTSGSAEVALSGPGEGQCACDDSAVGETSLIRDGAFAGDLEVPVGQTVTWVNDDDVPHQIVDASGSFTSGELPPDTSYSRQFGEAGTWQLTCEIHPQMEMVLTVR